MVVQEIPKGHRIDIEKAMTLLKNEGCKSVFLFDSMVTGIPAGLVDVSIKEIRGERFRR